VVARPRIGDVAQLAGVSKTAVSFAFNQPEHLNAATRDRILAAAEQLGYRPSPIARRLAALMDWPDELARAAAAAGAQGRLDAAERLADVVEQVAGRKA